MLKRLLLLLSADWRHAQAHADLADQAWQQRLCTLKNRWMLYALSAASLWLALTLGGVSLLLWSALPQVDAHHAWVLWALPLTLWLIGAVCWVWGRCLQTPAMAGDILSQIQLARVAIQPTRAS
jgi:hypothetical protein